MAVAAVALAREVQAADFPPFILQPATRDNSIWEESASLSNGAGVHLFSGINGLAFERRALIHFDLSPYGPLPPEFKIDGVDLTLECTQSPFGTGPDYTFRLHRLTAEWGEAGSDAGEPGGMGAQAEPGDATWNDRFFAQSMPWATPGGDFVTAPSATFTVGACTTLAPTTVHVSSPQLAADVEDWLDNPASNFGWILIGDEAAAATAHRFESREAADPNARPQLFVSFSEVSTTPATSPTGVVLLALGLGATATVVLLRKHRPRQSA